VRRGRGWCARWQLSIGRVGQVVRVAASAKAAGVMRQAPQAMPLHAALRSHAVGTIPGLSAGTRAAAARTHSVAARFTKRYVARCMDGWNERRGGKTGERASGHNVAREGGREGGRGRGRGRETTRMGLSRSRAAAGRSVARESLRSWEESGQPPMDLWFHGQIKSGSAQRRGFRYFGPWLGPHGLCPWVPTRTTSLNIRFSSVSTRLPIPLVTARRPCLRQPTRCSVSWPPYMLAPCCSVQHTLHMAWHRTRS